MITAYNLLVAVDAEGLSALVNYQISEGWQPFGMPYAFGVDTVRHAQAVVRFRSQEIGATKTYHEWKP